MTLNNQIWAGLLHLSYNMWADRSVPEWNLEHVSAEPRLRLDQTVWDDLLQAMSDAGMNMVVIDLGDGVRYDSHPEIAVDGAWSVAQLQAELDKARALGLEPIPKLNFSTAHDAWLGPYSRCVSTSTYYDVCRDLIGEVIELFGRPRFFHLGMDEETYEHQKYYEYAVVRQYDLWWRDLLSLVARVEHGGARAWVWSDYLWHHPDLFFARMPRTVVQSNWYYGASFGATFGDAISGEAAPEVKAYRALEEHGFDQIPTGSNWSTDVNFERTVAYCREHIAPERLLGFLQTVWKPTLEACRNRHMQAIEQVKQQAKR